MTPSPADTDDAMVEGCAKEIYLALKSSNDNDYISQHEELSDEQYHETFGDGPRITTLDGSWDLAVIARAAIAYLTPMIVERCVRICERHGHTDPALLAAIRRGE